MIVLLNNSNLNEKIKKAGEEILSFLDQGSSKYSDIIMTADDFKRGLQRYISETNSNDAKLAHGCFENIKINTEKLLHTVHEPAQKDVKIALIKALAQKLVS